MCPRSLISATPDLISLAEFRLSGLFLPEVPARDVAQNAVVEEDLFRPVHVDGEPRYAGRVVVDHHDAGAAQPLGLMNEQIAALVVHVVRNDEPL